MTLPPAVRVSELRILARVIRGRASLLALAALALALALAGCAGRGTATTTSTPAASPPATAPPTTTTLPPEPPTVRIVDGSFRPSGVDTAGATAIRLVKEDAVARRVDFEGDAEFTVELEPGETVDVDLSGESGVVRGMLLVGNLRAVLTVDVRSPEAAPRRIEPSDEYEFERNHPAAHGLSGRMVMEQVLASAERTVTVVSDATFQAGVGFECRVTFTDSDGATDETGFLFVGDGVWVDTGTGWQRPLGLGSRDTAALCGPGLPLFDDPAAGSLIATGEPVDDQVGDRAALRLDLSADDIGERLVLNGLVSWVGLESPDELRGTMWVVDRRWYGRVEAELLNATAGPLGNEEVDFTLTVTFPELGTSVELRSPETG